MKANITALALSVLLVAAGAMAQARPQQGASSAVHELFDRRGMLSRVWAMRIPLDLRGTAGKRRGCFGDAETASG